MEPLEYPDTLVENVKLLSWKVMKINKALAYAQAYLTKVEADQDDENWSLDFPHRKIEELENYLRES